MRLFASLIATATIFAAGSLVFFALRVDGADPPRQVSLELLIEAESISHGTPQAFTFSILNNTDQDVHLPNPTVGCSDSFDGAVSLNVRFRPLNPGDQGEGGGCASDRFGEWPSIISRLKSWQVLPAGKSLTIKADRQLLHYGDRPPGRYEFWATYDPPLIDKVDQEFLTGSGLGFPKAVLNSKHLTFDKPR